ncbi:MAG: hypothetical protein ACI9XO_002655 [Paraglaciecola sp.]|jgi:hypothetical protein
MKLRYLLPKITFTLAVSMILLLPDNEVLAQGKAQFVSLTHDKSQTEIPKRLERKFRRDAARLALRLNAEQEDLRYQRIPIPRQNIESFYNILSSIYLGNETAKSIEKCNVHTFPDPSIDHFVVIFDKTVEWAEPLRQGISETSSDDINDLLDDYDLIIEKHVQWDDTQDAITIRSKEPLNMAALANEFYNVEGITEIDLGIPKAGGNDIQLRRVQDGWKVEYILRFGSYISGEGKAHTWVYKALDSGTITFISESGDEIPTWMRCNFVPRGILVSERI